MRDNNKNPKKMKNLNDLKTFEGCTFEEWKNEYTSRLYHEIETLENTEEECNNYGEDVEYIGYLIDEIELTTEWVELFNLLNNNDRGWDIEEILEDINRGFWSAEWK